MQQFTRSAGNRRKRSRNRRGTEYVARIESDGHMVLPQDVVTALGPPGGAEVRVVVEKDHVQLFPSIHNLSRLYVEPTSACNLSCRTCVRNDWNEPIGDMDLALFDRLMGQLNAFKGLTSVMFGGFGEPTCHKDMTAR